MKRIVIIFSVFFICVSLFSQTPLYTISGIISFKGSGKIFLRLVSEEILNDEDGLEVGLQLLISDTDCEKGEMSYCFYDIPSGMYAIQAFQDMNGNGSFDTSIIGLPKEPFGFSQNFRPLFKAPKFDQISFSVGYDRDDIDFRLKK